MLADAWRAVVASVMRALLIAYVDGLSSRSTVLRIENCEGIAGREYAVVLQFG